MERREIVFFFKIFFLLLFNIWFIWLRSFDWFLRNRKNDILTPISNLEAYYRGIFLVDDENFLIKDFTLENGIQICITVHVFFSFFFSWLNKIQTHCGLFLKSS